MFAILNILIPSHLLPIFMQLYQSGRKCSPKYPVETLLGISGRGGVQEFYILLPTITTSLSPGPRSLFVHTFTKKSIRPWGDAPASLGGCGLVGGGGGNLWITPPSLSIAVVAPKWRHISSQNAPPGDETKRVVYKWNPTRRNYFSDPRRG